jgi:ABC-type lipoprotein export system ATPase subunit
LTPPALELRGLGKSVNTPDGVRLLFRDVNFCLNAGEVVGLIGRTGAGKSTLLSIAGTLCRHYEGRVYILGQSLESMSMEATAKLRNERLGFVFQEASLFDRLSVTENVELPIWLRRCPVDEGTYRSRVEQLLEAVDLSSKRTQKVATLSGGEKQKLELVRALSGKPGLLLADEPTSHLDAGSRQVVHHMLLQAKEEGAAVLLATHEPDLKRICDRLFSFKEGRVVEYAEREADDGGDPS